MSTKHVVIYNPRTLQTAAQVFAEEQSDQGPSQKFEVTINLLNPGDFDDGFVDSLIEVLQMASQTRKVLVCLDLFRCDSVSAAKLESLCDVIGNMPGLRNCFFFRTMFIPLNPGMLYYVSRIIRQQAKGLKELEFQRAHFSGSTEHFQEFGSALSACTGLTCLDFDDCRIGEECQTFENVNPVLNAVRSISKPTCVKFQCWIPSLRNYQDSHPSASLLLPLARALGHPLLHDMTIVGAKRLKCVSYAMQHHKISPKSLTVQAMLNDDNVETVSRIVANCSQRLKTIEWCAIDTSSPSDLTFTSLLAALGSNTSLNTLLVRFCHYSAQDAFPLAPQILEGFAEMLEKDNWTLTKLQFQVSPIPFHYVPYSIPGLTGQRIQYNLKLNRLGRTKLLLQDPNATDREDWIWRLHRSRNDLDCLYYFLSMNPLLCDNCGETKEIVDEGSIATRTRKRRNVAV